MMNNKENKYDLLGLLNEYDKFVIPIIQRDYVQGRNEGSTKEHCEEVRKNLIENLLNIKDDKDILLNYIYGKVDEKIFYPIDGQQRLTTLFLLYWYIGKKEKEETKDPKFNLLKKFTYEIRDTSKEFCDLLFKININFSEEKISEEIKKSKYYHYVYDNDPTVLSMLTVLDEIHNRFKNIEIPLWEKLGKIKFLCLSLEKYGLTDDLFVKMNARGKRLSKFEIFKSELESKLKKNSKESNEFSSNFEEWKNNVDNSYLDSFWKEFGPVNSERNLYRTILFFAKAFISLQKEANYDALWEDDELNGIYEYSEEIELLSDFKILDKLCAILSNFNIWKDLLKNKNFFIEDNEKANILFYEKARIFGILYWFSYKKEMQKDNNFEQYRRILDNYIFSHREYSKRDRRYISSIDNNNDCIWRLFGFIEKLVDNYTNNVVDYKDFNDYFKKIEFKVSKDFKDYINEKDNKNLSYEKAKLMSKDFEEIKKIEEEIPYIKGNTENVFIKNENKLYLNCSQIKDIFSDEECINMFIRIVLSYADEKNGKVWYLLMDETNNQSGKKTLYYKNEKDNKTVYFHKIIFNKKAEFGDNILTAKENDQNKDISKCVQKSIKYISERIKQNIDIKTVIKKLFEERKEQSVFNDNRSIKWYIVKYKEFFYNDNSTLLSVVRNTDDDKYYGNIYDIQCVDIDENFENKHYHPFYLALNNKLENLRIDDSDLKYTGVHIEYKHPYKLSNGWIIRIDEEGNWIINFNGNVPEVDIDGIEKQPNGEGIVRCEGVDSIERMAEVLNSIKN